MTLVGGSLIHSLYLHEGVDLLACMGHARKGDATIRAVLETLRMVILLSLHIVNKTFEAFPLKFCTLVEFVFNKQRAVQSLWQQISNVSSDQCCVSSFGTRPNKPSDL